MMRITRRSLVTGVAFVLAGGLLVFGCSSGGHSDTSSHNVQGTLHLYDVNYLRNLNLEIINGDSTAGGERDAIQAGRAAPCRSNDLSQGNSDIANGTPVTISDESGTVVGLSQLGDGSAVSQSASTPQNPVGCLFKFHVSVPTAKFYRIEVSHRGITTYSYVDLTSKAWTVQLSLGAPNS